ncbi:MAG: DUF6262 family protein [Clostridiales bacterium]
MGKYSKSNISGIKKYAQNKKFETLKKVETAIKELTDSEEKINFNSVSSKSGVSKTYLYNNKEVREHIELLRREQSSIHSPEIIKKNMSNKSKDILISAKNKKIEKLELENKYLKQELAKLRGKLYENI